MLKIEKGFQIGERWQCAAQERRKRRTHPLKLMETNLQIRALNLLSTWGHLSVITDICQGQLGGMFVECGYLSIISILPS